MSLPVLVPVENCPEIVCHLGELHILHVGALALGNRVGYLDTVTAEQRMSTRMRLPHFAKGPWPLSEARSTIRLRGVANPSSLNLQQLGEFAGKYGIDTAFSFPSEQQTDIAFTNAILEIPHPHDAEHTLTFNASSEDLMLATTRALGIVLATGCN